MATGTSHEGGQRHTTCSPRQEALKLRETEIKPLHISSMISEVAEALYNGEIFPEGASEELLGIRTLAEKRMEYYEQRAGRTHQAEARLLQEHFAILATACTESTLAVLTSGSIQPSQHPHLLETRGGQTAASEYRNLTDRFLSGYILRGVYWASLWNLERTLETRLESLYQDILRNGGEHQQIFKYIENVSILARCLVTRIQLALMKQNSGSG